MPILLALGSALVYGVGDYFGGRASRTQPSVAVTAIGQIISLALVAGVVVAMGTAAPDAATWWWSAGGGMLGALGITGLYHGFAHGDVSIVAPTSAVMGAALPVVVGLSLGERPTVLALVGIVIAVAAVALVSGAIGQHQHNTPPRIIVLAVAVGVCFGLLYVAFGQTDPDSGMWPLLIARFASVPMLLIIGASAHLRPARDRSSLQLSVVSGVFDLGANVLYLLAVRGGMLSVVSAVAALYPATTVALAFGIDKERVTRWQGIGLVAAAAALVLVSVSRN